MKLLYSLVLPVQVAVVSMSVISIYFLGGRIVRVGISPNSFNFLLLAHTLQIVLRFIDRVLHLCPHSASLLGHLSGEFEFLRCIVDCLFWGLRLRLIAFIEHEEFVIELAVLSPMHLVQLLEWKALRLFFHITVSVYVLFIYQLLWKWKRQNKLSAPTKIYFDSRQ